MHLLAFFLCTVTMAVAASSKDPTLSPQQQVKFELFQSTGADKEIIKLSQRGDEESVKRLRKYLQGDYEHNWGSALMVVRALGWIGPLAKSALPELRKVAGFEFSRGLNRTAGAAIERIAGCDKDSETSFTWTNTKHYRTGPFVGGYFGMARIESPGIRVIENQAGLESLWKEIGAHPTCIPRIDFSKILLIGLFTTMRSAGIEGIPSIQERDGNLDVKYRCAWTDTFEPVNPPGTKFLIVRVERPVGLSKVRVSNFEEKVSSQRLHGYPEKDCAGGSVEYAVGK